MLIQERHFTENVCSLKMTVKEGSRGMELARQSCPCHEHSMACHAHTSHNQRRLQTHLSVVHLALQLFLFLFLVLAPTTKHCAVRCLYMSCSY